MTLVGTPAQTLPLDEFEEKIEFVGFIRERFFQTFFARDKLLRVRR